MPLLVKKRAVREIGDDKSGIKMNIPLSLQISSQAKQGLRKRKLSTKNILETQQQDQVSISF